MNFDYIENPKNKVLFNIPVTSNAIAQYHQAIDPKLQIAAT